MRTLLTILAIILSVSAQSQLHLTGWYKLDYYQVNGLRVDNDNQLTDTITGVVFDSKKHIITIPVDSNKLTINFKKKHHYCSDNGLLKHVNFTQHVNIGICTFTHWVYRWDTAHTLLSYADDYGTKVYHAVIYHFYIGGRHYRVDFDIDNGKMDLHSFTASDSTGFCQLNFKKGNLVDAFHHLTGKESYYLYFRNSGMIKQVFADWSGLSNNHVYKSEIYKRKRMIWLRYYTLLMSTYI